MLSFKWPGSLYWRPICAIAPETDCSHTNVKTHEDQHLRPRNGSELITGQNTFKNQELLPDYFYHRIISHKSVFLNNTPFRLRRTYVTRKGLLLHSNCSCKPSAQLQGHGSNAIKCSLHLIKAFNLPYWSSPCFSLRSHEPSSKLLTCHACYKLKTDVRWCAIHILQQAWTRNPRHIDWGVILDMAKPQKCTRRSRHDWSVEKSDWWSLLFSDVAFSVESPVFTDACWAYAHFKVFVTIV